MKQNWYGCPHTSWLLQVQDLLFCLMFLTHAMAGGGNSCLEYALTYLSLSGKQDVAAGTIPYSASPNDRQCFIDYSNAGKRRWMKNFSGCKDTKHRWLLVERATYSLGQIQWHHWIISVTKIKAKQKFPAKPISEESVMLWYNCSNVNTDLGHLQTVLSSTRDRY